MGALLLAGSVRAAADSPDAVGPKPKPVLVDSLDLRPPIPEPRTGLIEYYDGKPVRFTGRVKASGQDARTKMTWYDLQTEVVHPAGVVPGKKGTPAPSAGKKEPAKVREVPTAFRKKKRPRSPAQLEALRRTNERRHRDKVARHCEKVEATS